MKRPSPMLRRGNDTDMNATMTPMIDVVFLLLVFFVWTASFQIVELILPSNLKAEMGSEQSDLVEPLPEDDFEDIVVAISWDGARPDWSINGEAVTSLAEVQTRLQVLAGINQEAKVILDPDGVVPLGNVIDVYDVAKLSGFAVLSFAVDPTQ